MIRFNDEFVDNTIQLLNKKDSLESCILIQCILHSRFNLMETSGSKVLELMRTITEIVLRQLNTKKLTRNQLDIVSTRYHLFFTQMQPHILNCVTPNQLSRMRALQYALTTAFTQYIVDIGSLRHTCQTSKLTPCPSIKQMLYTQCDTYQQACEISERISQCYCVGWNATHKLTHMWI